MRKSIKTLLLSIIAFVGLITMTLAIMWSLSPVENFTVIENGVERPSTSLKLTSVLVTGIIGLICFGIVLGVIIKKLIIKRRGTLCYGKILSSERVRSFISIMSRIPNFKKKFIIDAYNMDTKEIITSSFNVNVNLAVEFYKGNCIKGYLYKGKLYYVRAIRNIQNIPSEVIVTLDIDDYEIGNNIGRLIEESSNPAVESVKQIVEENAEAIETQKYKPVIQGDYKLLLKILPIFFAAFGFATYLSYKSHSTAGLVCCIITLVVISFVAILALIQVYMDKKADKVGEFCFVKVINIYMDGGEVYKRPTYSATVVGYIPSINNCQILSESLGLRRLPIEEGKYATVKYYKGYINLIEKVENEKVNRVAFGKIEEYISNNEEKIKKIEKF